MGKNLDQQHIFARIYIFLILRILQFSGKVGSARIKGAQPSR
jgi:hypothetical protein